MKIALENVAWDKALKELQKRYKKDKQWKWKRFEAEASSLSAFFITEFSQAIRRIAQAMGIEPFNPLHQYRLALLYMRFAQWNEALSVLDDLGNLPAGISFSLYLRALVFLKTGQLKRAFNITNEIKKTKPAFTWADFLKVEVLVLQKKFRLDKDYHYLRELPKGDKYLGVWIDLLVKIVIADPVSGTESVKGFLKRSKVLPEGSMEEKFIGQVIDWNTASLDVMRDYLVKIPTGSKTEQLALLFFHDHLKKSVETLNYFNELKRLYEMFPNHTAVRKLYIAALNRYAVEEAAAEKYRSTLAAVEVCLRLEPFNIVHYQNRATLFTLLRERESYHCAWEELERIHYRLALLGRIDRQNARLLVKFHRMFAQQARLTPKSPYAKHTENQGIFREEQTMINKVEQTILVVNQQCIDTDPEQLRQWIHHRKAELFFSHLALGTDPDHFLLGYSNDFSARTKLECLVLLGQSLSVLAGEDGQLLAQHIEKCWWELLKNSSSSDSREEENSEVLLLKKQHIETLGDLAMLCYCWQPKESDLELVEELIEFIEAEVLFLDGKILLGSMKGKDEEESYSISYLRQLVIEALDLRNPIIELSDQECKKVGRYLTNYLFFHLSYSVFMESCATQKYEARKYGARYALKIIERARGRTPDNPEIEFWAARLFSIGSFYKEARKAISRFYKVNKDDQSPYIAEVKKIQNELDKAGKGSGEDYIVSEGNMLHTVNRSVEQQLFNYIEELECYPSSIQTYEELTHLLVSEGRFKEAVEWSERAIDHCLNRKEQLKPRMLNIELLGLQKLGAKYPDEIKLYLNGVSTSLKEILEKISGKEPISYELLHLLGVCLWLEGKPQQAQKVFQEACEKCNNKIHLTVLQLLSVDVGQVFSSMVKEPIEQFTKDQRYDKAFKYIRKTIQKMKAPELMVIDLAAVQVAALAAKLKHDTGIPKIPSMTISASWNTDLEQAICEPDDLEKARRITLLAMDVHPPSEERGEEILQQIEGLKSQMDIAAVLLFSRKYLREGNFKESLRHLDSLGDEGNQDLRVLQMRAMLLLKLEEFEQADKVATRIESFEEPSAKTFVKRYPSLKFWQQISKVHYLLRKGEPSEAFKILDTLQVEAADGQLEATYCYAFALALKGYQTRLEGNPNDTAKFFKKALEQLVTQIEAARQNNHNGLLELYQKLNKDLSDSQEDADGYKK
jgi:tetratricopeptide (TPR) repeat protein